MTAIIAALQNRQVDWQTSLLWSSKGQQIIVQNAFNFTSIILPLPTWQCSQNAAMLIPGWIVSRYYETPRLFAVEVCTGRNYYAWPGLLFYYQ